MRASHRGLLVAVAVVAAVAAAGMVALWPDGDRELEGVGAEDAGIQEEAAPEDEAELLDARILEVTERADEFDDPTLLPGAAIVDITAETEGGEVVTFEMGDDTGDTFAEGQRVRLAEVGTADGETSYYVADFRRGPQMALLAGLFALAVIALGRFQGVRALVGLGLSFLVIIGFIVPAILDGSDPVWVALFGGLAVMIITLYLSHGVSAKTSAAIVGTAGALLLTVGLAAGFIEAAQLTGFTDEDARLANYQVGGLSLQGLLLAGIIIGGLGVLDDVTMSQSATVFALRRADPTLGYGELFRSALAVGRDHVAATVNTLFLAYAGAALPLLILFSTATDPASQVLTSEIVAVEVVRTLVGSIGLIAAVPFTTALAAAVAREEADDLADEGSEHDAEGAVLAAPEETSQAGGATPAPRSTPPPPDGAARVGPAAGSLTEDLVNPVDETGEEDLWVQRLRDAYQIDDTAGDGTEGPQDPGRGPAGT
ncbi:YibE/F family protein [Egibacter rhizosphaerae]|uniref:YibE/F family protein n=1 Tax=Egibacter rhizosphaerae TaxID=1670831 RepID=A0A411YES7_9ACTN|nr:YibE/F family protein [Egibacter rhizosphaerae]QBI19709.1 YibE/F family protein [Egibacter rhizosphaerae]